MNCPICLHERSTVYLKVKDYTVSNEIFELIKCSNCDFIFTNNPPPIQIIGKYYQSDAYISHTDSNEGMFNKLYQWVRLFSLQRKLNLVKQFSLMKTGVLLDYGCGTGSFLHFMKSYGWRVAGMEPDAAARKKASSLIADEVCSPDRMNDIESNHFDVITLWHVLEHAHHLHDVIESLKRVLKKNSILIVAVPNHLSWDAKHYKEHWAAYDVPRHLYHFNPNSMHALLSSHGFSKIAVHPMWFDAFYVSLLSEKYKTGKIRILPAIINGLISNFIAFKTPGRCSSQIFIYRSPID